MSKVICAGLFLCVLASNAFAAVPFANGKVEDFRLGIVSTITGWACIRGDAPLTEEATVIIFDSEGSVRTEFPLAIYIARPDRSDYCSGRPAYGFQSIPLFAGVGEHYVYIFHPRTGEYQLIFAGYPDCPISICR